jgi:hypothetical protein
MTKTMAAAAGHLASLAGYSDRSHGRTPSRLRIAAPMSNRVENGSSQCQAGPMSAATSAIPTQP